MASVRSRRLVVVVLLAIAGTAAGALIAGRLQTRVGPFHTALSLRMAWDGDSTVHLPPLGSLRMDTHDGLFGLTIRANELDLHRATSVANEPETLHGMRQELVADVQRGTRALLLRAALGGVAGAMALVLLREWSGRAAVSALLVAGVVLLGSAGVARLTWRSDAIAQPRYTGLLSAAPQAVGAVGDIQRRFDAYTDQLVSLVDNAVSLYHTASQLEAFDPDETTIRLLHVSDLHLNPQAFELIEELSEQFRVDAVVDTGDIVDWGTELEDRFTEIIGDLPIPYVYVRGNHDSAATAQAVAAQPNAVVLDRSTTEIKGLRLWGIRDPRFTPDKSSGGEDEQRSAIESLARRLPGLVPRAVDVVLVHDPAAAAELGGRTPLVLSGHIHRPDERILEGSNGRQTIHLVEGSTGGAGLRALRGTEPESLTASVLYFDADELSLVAYDRIEVGGLGESNVHIQRRIVRADDRMDSAEPEGP